MATEELREHDFMSELTEIINAMDDSDPQGAARLLPVVYEELRRLATRFLSKESPDQTLQATALVHEAYLRLVGPDESCDWNGRRHFFGAAAEAMRRILVESARRKRRYKHGGSYRRVDLNVDAHIANSPSEDMIALEEALEKLASENPRVAELVKLRYFAGLTITETADLLGVSHATAERDWTYAKSWLYCELSDDEASTES